MIAIIPARGGSKGLPGKNVRKLNGKPLIAYSILAAKNADCINKIIVSTDDEEIAEVAKQYGAEVPFIRPNELATDSASAVDVYIHAIEFLMRNEHKKIDEFMVLLPTAPLRSSYHIMEAYNLYVNKHATSLVSLVEADIPPSWYMQMSKNAYIYNCGFGANESPIKNRQDNRSYYVPNGAIYILNYDLLKNERTYYCENTVGYIMKYIDSVDIDSLYDFEYAEYLMKKRYVKNEFNND